MTEAQRIAYLGIRGGFSEQAARQHFGDDLADVPCQSFAQIFAALDSGAADAGVLPIENSLAGTVSGSYELLTQSAARIQGEVVLKIDHALLGLPGTTLADVREVRSHPQALAQCAQMIERHGWEPVSWYNTAGSARDLADDPKGGVAAIADPVNARLYGLVVLAEHIQDMPHNYTRFFILGSELPARTDHDKTSMIFTTRHHPGALGECLDCFARRGINLTKIESRPTRARPWEYQFYLDFEGHMEEARFREAVTDLLLHTTMLRVLGSYPAARLP